MDNDNTVWQPVEPTTPNPYNPYDGTPIPPPPPTPKRPQWWFLAVALVVALLLFAATGLVYEAHSLLTSQVKPTPTVSVVPATPTSAPTQQPTPTPVPPTPTPLVIVETATPTPMIVPYTASEIFQDFQAAGIAMSNIHTDNSWCHACDYIPSGGAIAWQDFNNTPTANVEIATFATTHATIDDGNFLASQGFPGYYKGRCLLFYNASTLADIQSYLNVMNQYCY